jgi:hypothetical protein
MRQEPIGRPQPRRRDSRNSTPQARQRISQSILPLGSSATVSTVLRRLVRAHPAPTKGKGRAHARFAKWQPNWDLGVSARFLGHPRAPHRHRSIGQASPIFHTILRRQRRGRDQRRRRSVAAFGRGAGSARFQLAGRRGRSTRKCGLVRRSGQRLHGKEDPPHEDDHRGDGHDPVLGFQEGVHPPVGPPRPPQGCRLPVGWFHRFTFLSSTRSRR